MASTSTRKVFDAVLAANRKQAMIPAGAQVLGPVRTAPGVVVSGKPTVVVLPGPPRGLQPMWDKGHRDTQSPAGDRRPDEVPCRPRSGYSDCPSRASPKRCAPPRRSIAEFESLEITTCLRRGEMEMVTRYEPDAAHVYDG